MPVYNTTAITNPSTSAVVPASSQGSWQAGGEGSEFGRHGSQLASQVAGATSLDRRIGIKSQNPLKSRSVEGRRWSPGEGYKPKDQGSEGQSDSKLDRKHDTVRMYCEHCGYVHVVTLKCKDRTCKRCRYGQYHRMIESYKKQVNKTQNLKILTLTIVNQESLDGGTERIRNCFNKLRRRKPYNSLWYGGMYTIEHVNKGNGWNIHMHVLVDGRFVPQDQISAVWLEITGDSMVVDIQRAKSPEGGLHYILKYLTKPPELRGDHDRADYNYVLRGQRLITVWGTWWGFKMDRGWGRPCPRCGKTSWITEWTMRDWYIQAGLEPPNWGR